MNRPIRLILLCLAALAFAAALWALLGALRGGIELWQQWRALPQAAQYAVATLLGLGVCAMAYAAWRILKPRRRKAVLVAAPTRAAIDARLGTLVQQRMDTRGLESELAELDRRAHGQEIYVALFGEISTGKSSLIHALAAGAFNGDTPMPSTDVLGGTTHAIGHYAAQLADGSALTLVDVPGSHEVSGQQREQIARDEALRAHVVLYVCAGDLTRDQDIELRWLRGFGKPLVLVLNKADRLSDNERAQLERALHERYRDLVDAQVVVSAGGSESVERHHADGRVEQVERQLTPDVTGLTSLLLGYATQGPAAFEHAREAAVLSSIQMRADVLAAEMRGREAQVIVEKYTKRAVIGALAAVMPGSDLVIQAVLATGLIRELSRLYDVPVRDIDIETFLAQVKLTVRTSASIVLAIAGNAAKAFPGLGTLGGGVLHAIAYGLIFDSLGRAVAATLRDHHAFDQLAAHQALSKLLSDSSAERLQRIADYALRGGKGS
jgi:GTP-binding protein EngB required for normal cell division